MYCNKCVREMNQENFYLDKTSQHMKTCKKCITMHVNVHEPSTFYHILKEVDIPFMPSEWENLVARYSGDPKKTKGSSILGRYLAKMKLAQYCHNKWADTDRLIEEHNQRLQHLKQAEEEQRTQYSKATGKDPVDEGDDSSLRYDFGSTMTRLEKDRMQAKWGRLYKEDEWIQLESFYNEMHSTYDIKGASHEDYLKMICKSSLKMNQAIDTGDIDGFSKLSKNYDQMMRSAKFTAVQNKTSEEAFISSIGEMVRLCEAEGFIPRYHDEENQDIVDLTIKDITAYLDRLVKTELNLGSLIESTIKQMEMQSTEDDEIITVELEDDDFLELSDLIDEGEILDDRTNNSE